MDKQREHEMVSKAVHEITKNREMPKNMTRTLQSQNQKSSKKTGNKGKSGTIEKYIIITWNFLSHTRTIP